ncbi:MAG: radical SAM protein [bacterium]
MLDILLINPNSSKNAYLAEGFVPPLGLCYISAYLKQHGFVTRIVDANALRLEDQELLSLIEKEKPLAIGLSAITSSIVSACELAHEIKKRFAEITIVLGGPHPTILAERTLAENGQFDIIVSGEGEITMMNFLYALKEKKSLESVKGIVWRRAGKIVVNESQPFIADLDSLPEPDRTDLPIGRYVPSVKWFNRTPFTTMMTSRGCPNNCIFCVSIYGHTVRLRSPQNVLAEIKNLISQYGIKEIMFYDDTFTLSKSRVHELCDLLIESKLDLTWGCLSRVDRVDEELLRKMKKAGCHLMCYGVESGSEEMLAIIRKNINLKQVEEAFRLTKKVGIDCSASFVFGVPGETKETMQKTIDLALKIDPLFAHFFRVVPLPGTELFDVYLKQRQSSLVNWSDFDALGNGDNLIKLERVSEEDFSYYLRKSYRNFYLRPRKIIQIFFKMLSLHKIKGLLIASYFFIKFSFLKRK